MQAHRMLGVAEIFQGDDSSAAQEFRKLLQPAARLPFRSLLDPPQVIDLFNGVLRAHEAEVANLEAKQREAARARQRDREECEKLRAGPTVIEKRFGRNSFLLNFVPFGAGTVPKRPPAQRLGLPGGAGLPGRSLGGGLDHQLCALTGSGPSEVVAVTPGPRARPPQYIDHTDENRSRWLLRTQVVTGAAFFAAVAWGIVDALYYFQPETPLAPAPSGQATASVPHLLPVLLGDALGPGLYFRF